MMDNIEAEVAAELSLLETSADPDILAEIREAAIDALHLRNTGKAMEETGRAKWIEGMLGLAKQLHAARQEFPDNYKFGMWLRQSPELYEISKNDRAAYVRMGEYLEQTRTALLKTTQSSAQHIWEKEIKPHLPPKARVPQTEEDAGVGEPERWSVTVKPNGWTCQTIDAVCAARSLTREEVVSLALSWHLNLVCRQRKLPNTDSEIRAKLAKIDAERAELAAGWEAIEETLVAEWAKMDAERAEMKAEREAERDRLAKWWVDQIQPA